MRCLSLLWLLTLSLTSQGKDLELVEHQASLASHPDGETPQLKSDTSDDEDSDNSDDSDESTEVKRVNTQLQNSIVQERMVAIVLVVELVISLVVSLFVALVYARWPRHQPSPGEVIRQSGTKFQYGLFDGCCHSCRICCCSWWCLPIRWAETASSSKDNFLNWGGRFLLCFSLFELLWALWTLTRILSTQAQQNSPPWFAWLGATLIFRLALLALQVMHRQHLRRQYGLVQGCCIETCDCLTWCFCGSCAAMQEALQVEYVGEPVVIVVEAEVLGDKDAAVV